MKYVLWIESLKTLSIIFKDQDQNHKSYAENSKLEEGKDDEEWRLLTTSTTYWANSAS